MEFSIVSRIGCWESFSFVPAEGSTGRGAVMLTPGIGPATDGLSGVSLFWASQALSTTSDVRARSERAEDFVRMVPCPVDQAARIAARPECGGGASGGQPDTIRVSARHREDFRRWLPGAGPAMGATGNR